jgi:excisionase family DNA binding protein
VEVFVEQDVVAPVGIPLEFLRAAIDGPPAMLVGGEYLEGIVNSRAITNDRLLRVHVLSRRLGCSRRTVRRLIEQHVIPAVRIGRRAWGVYRSDLPAVLALVGGRYARD